MPSRPAVSALACAALAACIQPTRLARDDSPVVLARQALAAPSPARPGDHRVLTLTYGSGTDRHRVEYGDSVTIRTRPVDGSKLVSAPTPAIGKQRRGYWGFGFDKLPVNGRVWYPDAPGPFPLVLIVHGNHDPTDFSDPGYAYLGQLLASRGYIVVSVDQNFLNGNLRSENDARGWMLLQHVAAWKRFHDSTGGPFHGRVDLDNVALVGHSRGGEAVAVAGLFNRLTHYPDDATVRFEFGFGIRALVAIAPIDGQYEPTSRPTPLENVNYLVIHGSHDGDVSAFSGIRQYERVRFTDGRPWFKAAIWMYRANHGQWNTVWGNRDFGRGSERSLDLGALIDPEAQREFAQVVFSAFFDATLKGRTEYLPLFRDHRVIGGWLPKTMYVTRFQESGFRALADFDDRDVDVTTGSVPGVTLEGDSLSTWRENLLPLRWRNANVGQSGVWLGWNNRIAGDDTTKRGRPAAYTVRLSDSLRAAWQVGRGTAIVLSLAPTDQTPGPRQPAKDTTRPAGDSAKQAPAKKPPPPRKAASDTLPVDLSIVAIDARGVSASLPLSRYGPIRRPLDITVFRRRGRDKQRFATMHELVLQTFVLPLVDFAGVEPGFDPGRLAAIRLRFDRTEAGTVVVSDIGLSNPAAEFLAVRP